jgi:hypothetical protein
LFYWCKMFILMHPFFLIFTQPSWEGYLLMFSPKHQLPRHTYNIVIFKKCAPSRDNIVSWIFYERLKSRTVRFYLHLCNNLIILKILNNITVIGGFWIVCPRNWYFDFRRNTDFLVITEIPRNSVHFRIRNSLYTVQYFMALPSFPLEFKKQLKLVWKKSHCLGKRSLNWFWTFLHYKGFHCFWTCLHYRGH